MKNLSIILSTVAIVMAAASLTVSLKTPCKSTKGSVAFTQNDLSNMLNKNPKIIVDAMQAYQIQQQEEAEKAANEALAKYADEINNAENAPFVGKEDAKVVMVEFFDFSCGYCKRLAPALEKSIEKNADVKFIFKPLTFLGNMSVYKAKAAMAAHKQGKFIEFYTKAMSGDQRDEAAVDAMAKEIGLNIATYKKDMESEEVQKALNEFSDLAQNIGVNGVPTLLVNGKKVHAYDEKAIQNVLDEAK